MKFLWCWRCKRDMPMLDADEFKVVLSKFDPNEVRKFGEKRFQGPMLDEYERITGFAETNINALYHHRLSLYGPPCSKCGKPLRSPMAKICASCWEPVANPVP